MSQGLKYVAGGGVGAWLYNQSSEYFDALNLSRAAELLSSAPPASSSTQTVVPDNSKQFDSLTRELSDLRRIVQHQQSSQPQLAIVHTNQGGKSAWYVLPIGAAVLYLAYLRFYKGVKLVDLMYVTKASLERSVGDMKTGLEGMSAHLSNTKKILQQQLDYVTSRTERSLKHLSEVQTKLGLVGADVEATRADVAGVHDTVHDLENSMDVMQLQQAYSNKGVYLLCGVLADMMKSSGTMGGTYKYLESFLQRSPPELLKNVQHDSDMPNAFLPSNNIDGSNNSVTKNSSNNSLEFSNGPGSTPQGGTEGGGGAQLGGGAYATLWDGRSKPPKLHDGGVG